MNRIAAIVFDLKIRRYPLGKVAGALCLAAVTLTAQESDKSPAALVAAQTQLRTSMAEAWLQSDDPLRVAWGAWLARVDRQTPLVPLLLRRLADYQANGGITAQTLDKDRRDSTLQVLDALIQLGTVVPVEDARKLYPEFTAQSLILLIRSGEDAQGALLEILDKPNTNWTWLAAGNALLKLRPQVLTARLLDRFTQHVAIRVVNAGFGGGGMSGGGECGDYVEEPGRGWPPVGQYQVTPHPERYRGAATFLIGGPATVYYRRSEPGNYYDAFCDGDDRDEYRAQFLARLLERSGPAIKLEAYPTTSIQWNGETDYRRQVTAAIEERVTAFSRIVASLLQVQLVTPDDAATLKPRLEIVITDDRQDKSVPLPILESGGGVDVRTGFLKPLP